MKHLGEIACQSRHEFRVVPAPIYDWTVNAFNSHGFPNWVSKSSGVGWSKRFIIMYVKFGIESFCNGERENEMYLILTNKLSHIQVS